MAVPGKHARRPTFETETQRRRGRKILPGTLWAGDWRKARYARDMSIDLRRGWLVPAGILLLLLIALWLPLREERKAGGGADIMTRGEMGAPSDQAAESAAEKARREAIGALGPIKRRDGINGADLYKRAIDLYSGLTDAEKEMLKSLKKKPEQEAAAALYKRIQPIMDLLRKARMANYADWGLGPMTVATNLGPQIDIERNLTSVALWDSSYRFSSDPDGAAVIVP